MTPLARLLSFACVAAAVMLSSPGSAQEATTPVPGVSLDGMKPYAPPLPDLPLPKIAAGDVTLAAQLTAESADIKRGLVWSVFKPEPGADGKLPLIASAVGGTATFQLEPGSYLVHVSFGRAGATKRISVARDAKRESLVLDAGGLELDAFLPGGLRIPPDKLRFDIYEAEENSRGERAMIAPDISPKAVVRLNAGIYHVVSEYGGVNAVIRSDIRVEAGKLTQATVEHKAADITLKLVRDNGGEAIADTSWSVLTDNGDIVEERVGAFASMVLAEGNYTVVAKNRDRIYQQDFEVVGGRHDDVEVLAVNPTPAGQPVEGSEVVEGSGDEPFE